MTTGPGSHEGTMTTDYWNHNTAYHPELLAGVPAGDSRIRRRFYYRYTLTWTKPA